MWINAVHPGEWTVQFSHRKYNKVELAAQVLINLKVPFSLDNERSRLYHRFTVLADAKRDKELSALFNTPATFAAIRQRRDKF